MSESYLVTPAEISWRDNTPFSDTYQDVYWSDRNGGSPVDEKQAVFVGPARQWAEACPPGAQLTICELGFGFGINCLLTADMWQNLPGDRRLNFISVEKHPVKKQDLAAMLERFGFSASAQLLAQYPPAYRGQHVIWLTANIRLLLIFEDINDALGNLDAEVDLWFLDGFSPSKNNAMWHGSVFRKMFARSRPGAEVVTYSAAGGVRRGLEYAGFTTEKVPGFQQKMEMIRARRPGEWQPDQPGKPSVTIIGAGLAGVFCAEALARRGIAYELIDGGDPGPSNIPQLSVMPQLAAAPEPRYRFSVAACHYMQTAPGYYQSGIHQFCRDDEDAIRLRQIAAWFPDELITSDPGKMILHETGWLAFDETRSVLINPPVRAQISDISFDGQWSCHAGDQLISRSDQLILATGFNRGLLPDQLQVRAIGGHAVSVKTGQLVSVTNNQVTLFPTYQGRSIISGTYEREISVGTNPEAIDYLLREASQLTRFDAKTAVPWTGIRAAARDRFPIVGQAPDWDRLNEVNRLSAITAFQNGLHFCTAFGSRGATHARLAAEHLVSKMLGEPAAVGLKEQRLLSPARFAIRDQ